MNDQSKAKQIRSQEPDALRRRIEELQQAKLAWKREKEELKEIEKKYRLLADNISDVIFVLDMNLNYTYVSPSVKILRGYELEEVLKQTTLESLVPASRELALKSLSEVMELEKSEQRDISISRTLQLELKRKDGTTVWTEVRFSFIRDEDQRPVGILGITRDITERKLVETTQNRLLYILESNLNEIYAFDSESLAFEYVNRGALINLGYTLEDMRRMTPLDLKPAFTEETFRQTIQPLLQHKQEQLIFETIHKRADGSLYPAEVHLQMVEMGKQRLFLAMIVDISERRKTEELLRETNEYLESLFNYANAPIITWNTDYRITRFNHAFESLSGYAADEIVGKELHMLFPQESREETLDKIARTSTGELWQSMEIPIKHKNGDIRIALWNSANIYAQNGQTLLATIAQGVDITERKQAEKRITDQFQELKRWYDVMLDREDRVIELKKEVNALLKQTGKEEKYKIIE